MKFPNMPFLPTAPPTMSKIRRREFQQQSSESEEEDGLVGGESLGIAAAGFYGERSGPSRNLGYDDEDDLPLYGPMPRRGLENTSRQRENSLTSPHELDAKNAKKSKVQPERLNITNQTLDDLVHGGDNED